MALFSNADAVWRADYYLRLLRNDTCAPEWQREIRRRLFFQAVADLRETSRLFQAVLQANAIGFASRD